PFGGKHPLAVAADGGVFYGAYSGEYFDPDSGEFQDRGDAGIYRYDLATGTTSLVGQLPSHYMPSSIAVVPSGGRLTAFHDPLPSDGADNFVGKVLLEYEGGGSAIPVQFFKSEDAAYDQSDSDLNNTITISPADIQNSGGRLQLLKEDGSLDTPDHALAPGK